MSLLSKVGTFTKTTSAATASQAVTGVGFQPKALILLTARQTSTGLATDGYWFMGVTDGTTSKSWGYAGGVSGLSQVGKESRKSKALTMNQYDGTGISECDLTSFDADGFTLSWTTNDSSAYIIGYLALGGSDLSAKVIQWTTRSTSGAQGYTGAGFQPNGLLSIGGGYQSAPPSVDTHQEGVLACAAAGDGYWFEYTDSLDAFGTVNCSHIHTTSQFENAGNGTFTSFDSDGWTVTYAASSGFTIYRAALVLRDGTGDNFRCNKFTRTTNSAPATQTVNFTTSGSMDLTWNPNRTGGAGPVFYFGLPGKFMVFSGGQEVSDSTSLVSNHVTEIGFTDGTNGFYVVQQQQSGNSSSAHPVTYSGTSAFGDVLSSGGSPSPQSIISSLTLTSPTTYTLTAAQGSYTLTGENVIFTGSRKVVADTGFYVLTGENAGLSAGRRLTADFGSYVLTGESALARYTMSADSGLYTLTGEPISRVREIRLEATTGFYVLTGEPITIGRSMAADTGFYVVTGEAAAKMYSLGAETGLYVLTGEPVGSITTGNIVLVCDTGYYVVTGFVDPTSGGFSHLCKARLVALGPNLRRS